MVDVQSIHGMASQKKYVCVVVCVCVCEMCVCVCMCLLIETCSSM